MADTFLILWSGGVLLAGAVSDPRAVTLRWLRLGGILGLCLAALSGFFLWRRDAVGTVEWALWAGAVTMILAQLTTVQVAWRAVQRACASLAFIAATAAGAAMLRPEMRGGESAALAMAAQVLACAGTGAMAGLVLMDMLLGHAYLTASAMTMRPFERLNRALDGIVGLRILLAVGGVLWMQQRWPREMLWGMHGLLIATRWAVGLLIPAIFIYMAGDCIRRRATQSATGILYVAGVLVVVGEIIAVYLMRQTGMPF